MKYNIIENNMDYFFFFKRICTIFSIVFGEELCLREKWKKKKFIKEIYKFIFINFTFYLSFLINRNKIKKKF